MVTIKEVNTRKELKKFVQFQYDLYKDNKYWVPKIFFDEMNTLDKNKNPVFEFCKAKYFLAYKDGKIVGRIAGIIHDKYIEKWGNKYARFGWVDFIDDSEVSKALFDSVEKWAKENGMVKIHGPLGFTDFDYEGMLFEGYDEIGTMATIYNYPYYNTHMQKLGFVKDVDWFEYEVKVPDSPPDKVVKLVSIVKERYKLKTIEFYNTKDLMKYAHQMLNCIEIAFKDLYGVTPLSKKQVDNYIKQYLPNVNPRLIKVVLNENDNLIGVVICIPSLARALQKTKGKLFPFGFIEILKALKKSKYLELLVAGVDPAYQGKGVDVVIMYELTMACKQEGILFAETNVELEENEKVRSFWKYFDARQHKKRRCYIKIL